MISAFGLLVGLTSAFAAEDLGTYTMEVAGNQPPSGYTADVIHGLPLPRDSGGVIAGLTDGTSVTCAWSKAKVVVHDGWPRAIVKQNRATWSTPPSSTTCSTTYAGETYSITLSFSTYTVDYSNDITNFSTGLDWTLPTDFKGSTYSQLPSSSAGYVEETTWGRKNGSAWYDARCTVVGSTGGSVFWLRVDLNDDAVCTAAQNCKCRYREVGGSWQETPLVVSR